MFILVENDIEKRLPTVTNTSILGFFGIYRFLSNFYPCDIKMPDGLVYPSSENAYMAMKTTDISIRLALTACSPKEARKIGINPEKTKLLFGWDKLKLGIMEEIIRLKFNLPGLRPMLLATEDKLLSEHNNWGDSFWGFDIVRNKGENHLGKIIMKIRGELKNG